MIHENTDFLKSLPDVRSYRFTDAGTIVLVLTTGAVHHVWNNEANRAAVEATGAVRY